MLTQDTPSWFKPVNTLPEQAAVVQPAGTACASNVSSGPLAQPTPQPPIQPVKSVRPTAAEERTHRGDGIECCSEACCAPFECEKDTKRYGCLGFIMVSLVMSAVGAFLASNGNWTGFGIVFTLDNMCMSVAMGFFFGPRKFCKGLFRGRRTYITLLYWSLMVGTILLSVWPGVAHGWIILAVIMQKLAWALNLAASLGCLGKALSTKSLEDNAVPAPSQRDGNSRRSRKSRKSSKTLGNEVGPVITSGATSGSAAAASIAAPPNPFRAAVPANTSSSNRAIAPNPFFDNGSKV